MPSLSPRRTSALASFASCAPMALLLLVPSCAPNAPAANAANAANTPSVKAAEPSATALATVSAPVFIEDDYSAALLKAKGAHLPLFIDTWATWCHSCQSLRQYVFPSKEVREVAPLAVFLSIDSEKEENAAFIKRFTPDSLPTLWMIDPRSETVLVKWSGAPSPLELAAMIKSASAAYASGEPRGAEAALMRAEKASTEERYDDAVAAYKDALAAAPSGWPKRAHALDALTGNLEHMHAYKDCFELGKRSVAEMSLGTPRANLLATTLGCGASLDAHDRASDGLSELAKMAAAWARDASAPILADDRSGLFESSVAVMHRLGDDTAARAIATEWSRYLDGEAARAKTSGERAVFDPHRLGAYLEVGTPERAIPMLLQSAADFPTDYNPLARLAVAYNAMKRYADATTAIDKAIALGYGPRRVRLFSIKADIEQTHGDTAKAEAALQQALAVAATDPLAKMHPAIHEQIEKRIHSLHPAK